MLLTQRTDAEVILLVVFDTLQEEFTKVKQGTGDKNPTLSFLMRSNFCGFYADFFLDPR